MKNCNERWSRNIRREQQSEREDVWLTMRERVKGHGAGVVAGRIDRRERLKSFTNGSS